MIFEIKKIFIKFVSNKQKLNMSTQIIESDRNSLVNSIQEIFNKHLSAGFNIKDSVEYVKCDAENMGWNIINNKQFLGPKTNDILLMIDPIENSYYIYAFTKGLIKRLDKFACEYETYNWNQFYNEIFILEIFDLKIFRKIYI